MNKVLYALLSIIALTSCSSSYNIEGSSNVSMLDGHKLYLKIIKNDVLKDIDSCDVVHGKFTFMGNIDSTKIANIYMDEDVLLPVVLESGDISIKINNTQHSIGGTPLNDKLYKFLKSFAQLQNESVELVHRQNQAYMNGSDMEVVNRQLAAKDADISQKLDKLITSFIVENFDNVLGPYVFQMATADYRYPMFEPWIEDILSKATNKFKNDPYVSDYVNAAKRNQDIMNGMVDPDQMPAPSAPGTENSAVQAPPTPAELAGDTVQ